MPLPHNQGMPERPHTNIPGKRPESIFAGYAAIAAQAKGHQPDHDQETTHNPLAEKLKEKKEPKLSDFNPLLYPPDFSGSEAMEAFGQAIKDQIDHHGGLRPTQLESVLVFNQQEQKHSSRFIIRFEVDRLIEEQIIQLEELVKRTYGTVVRTRTSKNGSKINPVHYPSIEEPKKKSQRTRSLKLLGWYMGSNSADLTNHHTGLLVFKDLGDPGMGEYLKRKDPKQWFYKDDLVDPMGRQLKTKYVVELREAAMYQTDLVEFAVQVASILAQGKPVESPDLLYQIYNHLNRVTLKKSGRDSIHGLDEQIDRIKRVLVLPLANLSLATGINLTPGSALLIGVPGTGKTLIAEYLLREDTGVFILPLDPNQLKKDLSQSPENRTILPRIAKVFARTQTPVIIHMDDVENISASDTEINSTLLNLMAGVREQGFYVIASTNHPEKLNDQLIQPQRFAHVIYLGLHDLEARRGILDIHATRLSRELGKSLFTSEAEREAILDILAKNTEGVTPRFLAEVCNEAKTFYLRKMAESKRAKGLNEEDIQETDRFTVEDWLYGLEQALRKYDKKAVLDRDRELQRFVQKHSQGETGFAPNRDGVINVAALKLAITEAISRKPRVDS